MTKSQVYLLDKSLNDLPLNNRPNIKYEDLIYTSDAMEEYSEEMACGFTEWLTESFKRCYPTESVYNNPENLCLYSVNGYNPEFEKKIYTTKELYQLYLEHLNK